MIENVIDGIGNALAELGTFNLSRKFEPHRQILRVSLVEQRELLRSLQYSVCAVGEPGSAKTTTICAVTGLMVDGPRLVDRTLFLTGSGRVTPFNVETRHSNNSTALTFKPIPKEDLEFYVGIMVKSTIDKAGGTPEEAVPQETQRCIRGLSGYRSEAAFATFVNTTDDPLNAVLNCIDHANRTRLRIEYSNGDVSWQQWLKRTFRNVCDGTEPGVPLPSEVLVEVPIELSQGGPYKLAYADTRGLDSPTVRKDILQAIRNERTSIMVTCEWNNAPSPFILELLRRIHEEDPRLLQKFVVVVTHKDTQWEDQRDDVGEYVTEREAAYGFKCGQVTEALRAEGITQIAVLAFDAKVDDPGRVRDLVNQTINGMRNRVIEAAHIAMSAVTNLPATLAAVEGMFVDLLRALERHSAPTFTIDLAFQRTIRFVSAAHVRRVWATARRRGHYDRLNFFNELAEAMARQARLETANLVAGIIEVINNKLDDPSFAIAHDYLKTMLADIDRLHTGFLDGVRVQSRGIYTDAMNDAAVWGWRSDGYTGFSRGIVVDALVAFSASQLGSTLHAQSQRIVSDLWIKRFINPLRTMASSAD